MDTVLISALLTFKLSNPATPWLVLAVVGAAWLAVYLFVSSEPRS